MSLRPYIFVGLLIRTEEVLYMGLELSLSFGHKLKTLVRFGFHLPLNTKWGVVKSGDEARSLLVH